jgi:hypothetical protein
LLEPLIVEECLGSREDSYESIDAALQDADDALAEVLKDIYGD